MLAAEDDSFRGEELQEGTECGVCKEYIVVNRTISFCGNCANQVLIQKKEDLVNVEEERNMLKEDLSETLRKLNLEKNLELARKSAELQNLSQRVVSAQQKLTAERLVTARLEQRMTKAQTQLRQLELECHQKEEEKEHFYQVILQGLDNHLQDCLKVEKRRRMLKAVQLFGLFNIVPSIPNRIQQPISGFSTILSLPLANSGNHQGVPAEVVSAALSHTGRLVAGVADELGTKLPHPIIPPRYIEIDERPPHVQMSVTKESKVLQHPRRFLLGQDGRALHLLQRNIQFLCLFQSVGKDDLFPPEAVLLNLYVLFKACSRELMRLNDGPDLPLPPVEPPDHIYHEMELNQTKRSEESSQHTVRMKLVSSMVESDPEVEEKSQLKTDFPLGTLMIENYFSQI